ncbi:MAG: chitobiase/beta-hexosaminidase C-terminal domain-containing protein [Rectinemataceae bacterium]|nr:chitobiase/beta-hexosaminidase C-terminal domain-containing protein [Rectinemataceae bacterium]
MQTDRIIKPIPVHKTHVSLVCWIPLFLLAMLFSCNIGGPDPSTTTTTTTVPPFVQHQGDGSMLLRHGAWLYRIGGLDESSLISASTRMASVDSSGNMGTWQDTAPLPLGTRHGAALAAGNLVYVFGGRTDGGLVSTIYFTSMNAADGTLGFGAGRRWESNLRPLPEARAYAACVLHDGWIFLIGGEIASGATNSIIRARLYQDGQVGQWYKSAQVLPDAFWGAAAAVLGNRLYVAGGANLLGVKHDVVSFALGEYGSLSDRRGETSLPKALQEAVLVADREDLILAGGFEAVEGSNAVNRYGGGTWAATTSTAAAAGPSSGRAGGVLLYLPQSSAGSPVPMRLDGLALAPAAPVMIPGSGMVPNNSPIRVVAEPGVTVRYRTDGGTPTVADPVYPGTPIKVSAGTLPSMQISLAAFSADGTSSPIMQRSYRVRATGMFVLIENTLTIHPAGYSSLEHRTMQETGSGGSPPTPVDLLWYRMRIDTAGTYRLNWADADENAAYSARLMLSVYEVDLYTEVPDLADISARDRRGGTAAPLHFALNSGDYYVLVSDIDSLTGRDFGLALAKE